MGDSCFARCLQGGGVYVHAGTVSIVNSQIYSNTAAFVRTHLQKFPSPRWEILLTYPIDSHLSQLGSIVGSTREEYAPATPAKPHRPMGFSHVLDLCLQGGGVYIFGGTVTLSSCTITGNTAPVVLMLKSSLRPDEKMADVLDPTHACITANAPVNYSMCVLQRP